MPHSDSPVADATNIFFIALVRALKDPAKFNWSLRDPRDTKPGWLLERLRYRARCDLLDAKHILADLNGWRWNRTIGLMLMRHPLLPTELSNQSSRVGRERIELSHFRLKGGHSACLSYRPPNPYTPARTRTGIIQ